MITILNILIRMHSFWLIFWSFLKFNLETSFDISDPSLLSSSFALFSSSVKKRSCTCVRRQPRLYIQTSEALWISILIAMREEGKENLGKIELSYVCKRWKMQPSSQWKFVERIEQEKFQLANWSVRTCWKPLLRSSSRPALPRSLPRLPPPWPWSSLWGRSSSACWSSFSSSSSPLFDWREEQLSSASIFHFITDSRLVDSFLITDPELCVFALYKITGNIAPSHFLDYQLRGCKK